MQQIVRRVSSGVDENVWWTKSVNARASGTSGLPVEADDRGVHLRPWLECAGRNGEAVGHGRVVLDRGRRADRSRWLPGLAISRSATSF